LEHQWLCRDCGYDLRTLLAGKCPECGQSFDPAVRSSFQPTRRPLPRWFGGLQLALALSPVIWLVPFYAMMGLARIELGRWPMVYQDNPAFFGLEWLLEVLMLSGLILPLFSVAAMVMGLVMNALGRTKTLEFLIRVWLAFPAWGLLIVVVRTDPGGCFDWFID